MKRKKIGEEYESLGVSITLREGCEVIEEMLVMVDECQSYHMVLRLSGILTGMDSGSEKGKASVAASKCTTRNSRGGFETCWEEDPRWLDSLSDPFDFGALRRGPNFCIALAFVY